MLACVQGGDVEMNLSKSETIEQQLLRVACVHHSLHDVRV